ncbi:MAG: GAF domain-containing protein [Anaerolineales bacterium]|nr:GAF domain-containing protein [Anaerolineales bacterium]
MRNRFLNYFKPTSPDPESAQRQSVLYILLAGLALSSLAFGVGMTILAASGEASATAGMLAFASLPFYIVAFLLARRGRTKLASWASILFVYAVTLAAMLQTGLGPISTIGLALLVTSSALLLGPLSALFFTAASAIIYIFLDWFQGLGLMPEMLIPRPTLISNAIGLAIGLAVLIFINWYSNRQISQALDVEREITEQLQGQRRELEELVAQRTRGLERRAIQLQTTSEIAKMASELSDPQALMVQAIELIRSRFGFYHASIFIMDETGNWANLAASTGDAGRQMMARQHRLAVGSASIIGWVTANRLPRTAHDVEADPYHFKNPLLPETRSELAVPLLVGDRLLGALDVQSTEPSIFADDDVRALEAIASELAVTIDSTRIQKSLQDRLERLETSSRSQIQSAWRRIGRQAAAPTIHLDVNGDRIAPQEDRFTLTAQAYQEAKTVVSSNGLEIAVPVNVRGESIATIAARRPVGTEPWNDEEIALVEAIASQAALSLESARQRADEERRLMELEVINRVSQAVSQMLRLDAIYRVVERQLDQIMGDVEIAVAIYDDDPQTYTVQYASEGSEMMVGVTSKLTGDLISSVIRSRQPMIFDEEIRNQAALFGIEDVDQEVRSWLGVPMQLGEEILGVLAISDLQNENRFSEDDAALLATIASQVAAGIQNAKLLDQVQRSARRERLIYEITSKVRRSPDMKSILDTTTRELGRALNAARSTITLSHQPTPPPDDTDAIPGGIENDQTGGGA